MLKTVLMTMMMAMVPATAQEHRQGGGPQYFKSDVPKRMYANFPAGVHTMYIGEVVNAWRK